LGELLRDSAEGREPRPRWHAWAVALIILAAVAVRLYRLHCGYVGVDGAICGLLGVSVLAGRWPLFFYGQDFMGALDGYLAAPVYALFGPDTLTLNIWSPIFSLATLLVLHACLRRYCKPLPSLIALAYLALPPAMAYLHAGKPNNHYPLGILLCALLMWFSYQLWEQKPWRKLTALAWGLTAGLALWTNFQAVVVIWACMLFLALTRLARLRLGPLLSGLAGALLGAGPLIYYNVLHHWKHGEQGQSFSLDYLAPHWRMLWENGLPIALGFNTPAAGGQTAPGSPWFFAYMAVAALLVLGLALLLLRGLRRQESWALLPLLVTLMSLAVLVSAIYGRELYDWDLRYLLPVYLGLPFAWAALAQALTRWGRWAALLLGALLLTLNLSSWPGFAKGVLFCGWQSFRHEVEYKDREFIASLRQAGFTGIYMFNNDFYRLAFFAGERPQFTGSWEDRRQYAAVQVDSATQAAFLDPPQESLAFLGLAHKTWQGRVFHCFQPPQGADYPLPRHNWRFSGVGGFEPGNSLKDGDLRSGFPLGGPEGRGRGFLLDLGQARRVGGLVLLPPEFRAAASDITVEAAGQDGVFQTIAKITDTRQPIFWSAVHPFFKARYPRMECYFPPRELRYLRVTQHAPRNNPHPGLIGEVLVLGAWPEPPPAVDWPQSAKLATKLLRDRGVKKIYADAWLSACLRREMGTGVWTLPANYQCDDYGASWPPPEEPLFVDAAPGSALVVPLAEAGQAREALSRAGVRHESLGAGRLEVFLLHGPASLVAEPWPLAGVVSGIDPESAGQLAKGRPAKGRWGSQTPQRPGMSLTVDLGQARPLQRLRLENPSFPLDYPRGLALELSQDGLVWRPVQATLAAPLAYGGRGLFAAGSGYSEYVLDQPENARYLRLTLTQGVDTWWWSVEKLAVFSR